MKLSLTTDYAVQILRYLHEHQYEAVSAKEIVDATGVTYTFVMKLSACLKDAYMIEVVQGRQGGYTLRKPVHQISLYDVYTAVGGKLQINNCLQEIVPAGTRTFFDDLQSDIVSEMSGTYISDLI